MSDDALWKLVNGPAKPKLGLDLSNRHNVREDATGKFAVKPTDAPGQPEPTTGIGNNGSLRHPASGKTLILKRAGVAYTTALIASAYGIKLSNKQMNEPGSTLVKLNSKQLLKLLDAVQAEFDELNGDDSQDPAKPQSKLSAAEKEGRVSSTGPRSGFGVPMKELRSGGLVAASNADHGATILTPTNYEPWESIEQGSQPALSQLSQDILNSIPRTN